MEGFFDALVEISRIGNFKSLWRELRIATTMFADAFSNREGAKEGNTGVPYEKTVIFMQGFFANTIYYRRFLEFFDTRGIRVVCPLLLARNVVSYTQARNLLSNSIKDVEDRFGVVPDLVGHSKGGTDILGILGRHEEIKHAYLIAAPLRGSSLNALTFFIKLMHHDPGHAIDKDLLEDKKILRKITTIVTSSDSIVPLREATLPGAYREIPINRHTGDESIWDSHTGLPYHARKELMGLLHNGRKAA